MAMQTVRGTAFHSGMPVACSQHSNCILSGTDIQPPQGKIVSAPTLSTFHLLSCSMGFSSGWCPGWCQQARRSLLACQGQTAHPVECQLLEGCPTQGAPCQISTLRRHSCAEYRARHSTRLFLRAVTPAQGTSRHRRVLPYCS